MYFRVRWVILCLSLGLMLLGFQNCSGNDATFTEKPVLQASNCAGANSFCVGNKTIRSVNAILTPLGQFEIASSLPDGEGFYRAKIKNPETRRIGFIKVKYNDSGRLVALSDPQPGALPENSRFVCLDHWKPGTMKLAINSDGEVTGEQDNCYSPIRVFDDQDVVEIGNPDFTRYTRVPIATADSYRFEIPLQRFYGVSTLVDPYYAGAQNGCRCQMSSSYIQSLQTDLSRISNGQDQLYDSLSPDDWIRVTFSRTPCLSAPADFNYFSRCEFIGSDFVWPFL